MKIDGVMDGLVCYVRKELYPAMNEWQKVIAADVVSRCINRAEILKAYLENNTYARALGYIDSENNIDIDGIMARLKDYINEKGKITVQLPLMPEFTFYGDDIDALHRMIKEGRYENH